MSIAALCITGLHNVNSRLPEMTSAGWGRRAFFPVVLLLILTGCGSSLGPELAALPTIMATAANPLSADESLASGAVPPTWTPLPPGSTSSTVAADEAVVRLVSPSGTPAIHATIPTNTPVPPTVVPTATPADTPTATPYVSFIPDLPPSSELGPSKLGVHVLHNNDPVIMEFVRHANPVVMKAIGDFGFLAEARALSRRTTIIGRIDDIWIQNYIGTPEEAAQEYVSKHLATYELNPAVDYWEGWNEPDPPTYELMSWYTRFEQERVRLMAQRGLRSAIGGFPQGTPNVDEFALFMPAIETAIQHQGILTLHEGDLNSADLRYLYGSPLPGYPAYADRGAGTFRYRWFYRELLEPNGLEIPLVISELNFAGWDHMNESDLFEQVVWYDSEVRKDGYVIGFTIFTAGATGWGDIWDINRLLPQFAAYVASQR